MSNSIIEILKNHNIKHMTTHSEKVGDHTAFFAVQGYNVNGNDFIEQALSNGAKIVFSDDKTQTHTDCYIVDDINIALAEAAEFLYPIKDQTIIAITGTNGKTSTSHFYMQILQQQNIPVAAIGTAGIYYFDGTDTKHMPVPGNLTTSDALTFRQVAQELYKKGIKHIAIEASSHGLHQKRMWGVPITAAGFTSFSHDHLDYHKTVEDYLAAKMMLFANHTVKNAPCYISCTIPNYQEIKQNIINLGNQCAVIGNEQDCDILIDEVNETIHGIKARITTDTQYQVNTQLIGDFQISNAVIAWQLAISSTNIDFPISVISNLYGIPGRMERISHINDNKHVFVDYSHTPDSLQKSLESLKKLCKGRLLVVFGCGGDRDASKRPIMGKTADQLADIVIVTDDNPRLEDASTIRKQIIQMVPKALEIGDRQEAIRHAIDIMQYNDILLIAGKGHEDYQIIGAKKIHLDDREIARKKLQEK